MQRLSISKQKLTKNHLFGTSGPFLSKIQCAMDHKYRKVSGATQSQVLTVLEFNMYGSLVTIQVQSDLETTNVFLQEIGLDFRANLKWMNFSRVPCLTLEELWVTTWKVGKESKKQIELIKAKTKTPHTRKYSKKSHVRPISDLHHQNHWKPIAWLRYVIVISKKQSLQLLGCISMHSKRYIQQKYR